MQTTPQDELNQYQQALLHNPKDLNAQIQCGNLCVQLGRFEEAAGYFRRVVRVLKSDGARNALCFALQALGNQAHAAGQYVLAEAGFEEALLHQPGNAIFWYNCGNAQREQGKIKPALHSFKQSILYDAFDADAHNNLGNIQRELGQLDHAIRSYENALQLNPNLHHALAHLVHQKQHICDWVGLNAKILDAQIAQLQEWVKNVPTAQISPFAFLAMPNTTPQQQLQCASNYANTTFAHLIALRQQLNFTHPKQAKTKLKIGYLSADFRLHPLAFLITDLIENHDKTQFETVAYSYGLDDKTPERKRLERAFDQFTDIRTLNDAQAASKIHNDGIDILVDLTGYTQSSRTAIVALKPAPISVNWLGYAGTMGMLDDKPLFDYLLADRHIAVDEGNFAEQLLHLPFYQPNNKNRPMGKATSRIEHGLQADCFVYCCFNQSFKITTEVFAAWLQILHAVPNSVLWLLDCNPWAKANLLAACEAAGIEKERLIFAPRVPIAEHLARHVHADLFLDTLPYNAHTTASDALFMGLPLLTCMGNTFASRVAASMLYRINCNELVTAELSDYVQKAITLANNPAQLQQLKQKMQQNAQEQALFSPAHFMQNLALQYQKIWNKFISSV